LLKEGFVAEEEFQPSGGRVHVDQDGLDQEAGGYGQVAPIGPRMNAQTTSDRKRTVVVRPTASPTNFGCKTD